MLCNYSSLKPADVEAIQKLESKLSRVILAVSCQDAKPASLKDEELSEIKRLESEIGVALVALA